MLLIIQVFFSRQRERVSLIGRKKVCPHTVGLRRQWVYKRLLQFLRLRGLFWNVVGYAATPRLCLGAIRSSKIIFCDTGSQLAVLTLLNFFILSSDYWKYFTGQFACQCWCSYLAVVIIIRDLDVCGYHAWRFDLLVLAAKFEENDDGKRGQICEVSHPLLLEKLR